MFFVSIEKRALKDIYSFPRHVQNVLLQKIDGILSVNPFPVGKNPKKLQGIKAYRLRIGDYRVLYTVEKNSVFIYAIGHRKDVYT